LFFAGEATDCEGHNGTVHGAIASGKRAAQEILAAANANDVPLRRPSAEINSKNVNCRQGKDPQFL
jgi:uncharacterized protein with NAD-binding domain and iron-sulfur cluster